MIEKRLAEESLFREFPIARHHWGNFEDRGEYFMPRLKTGVRLCTTTSTPSNSSRHSKFKYNAILRSKHFLESQSSLQCKPREIRVRAPPGSERKVPLAIRSNGTLLTILYLIQFAHSNSLFAHFRGRVLFDRAYVIRDGCM
jgi:hypothetical protein